MKQQSLSAQTFKYWEVFLSWLFKYPSRCFVLNLQKTPIIFKNYCKPLYQFAHTYRWHSASKGIICTVTPKFKDIDRTAQILKRMYYSTTDPQLCELTACEIMAKVMAYRNLKIGHTIPFPILQPSGQIKMHIYVVDQVFDLWNKIRAFGLTCSENKGAPILLFRGTDFSLMSEGGRASIISDLDPRGPGRAVFKNAKQPIHDWLVQQPRKARVIGHSLGGIISAYTIIYEAAHISQEKHEASYAFNFPGVEEDLIKKWDAIKHKPHFKGIISRGDVISKLGKLFGTIFEVSLTSPLSPIRAHEQLLFAEPYFSIQEVDVAQENISNSRRFYSKLQRQTSSVIYDFGLKFLFPNSRQSES